MDTLKNLLQSKEKVLRRIPNKRLLTRNLSSSNLRSNMKRFQVELIEGYRKSKKKQYFQCMTLD